ncbi:MAG: winged helix-turn-helix domain-containing protein [Thermoplasmata archaeon]
MMTRPDLFVIGRLLEALNGGRLRRTQLQLRAGVNYTVFQRYLELLVHLDLIREVAEDEGRLELTPRGAEAYRFLSEGLSRLFGPVAPSHRP